MHRNRFELLQAIDVGLRSGFNLIDTAQGYGGGASELCLSRILGEHVREDLFLVSKFGIHYPDSKKPLRRDASGPRGRMSLEQTLWNLNTDYVDAYMVHWPDWTTPMEDIAEGLVEIRRSGKARYIGVCNFTLDQLEQLHRHVRLDLIQYPYSIVDRRLDTQGIIAWARSNSVWIMTYGSLGFGSLLAQPENDWPSGDWRRDRPDHFGIGLFRPDKLGRIHQCNFDIAVVKAWLMRQTSSDSTLIGFQRASEVHEFLNAPDARVDLVEVDRLLMTNGIDPAPATWLDEFTSYALPASHRASVPHLY